MFPSAHVPNFTQSQHNNVLYHFSWQKNTQAGFGAWDLRVQEPKVWVARVQRVKN